MQAAFISECSTFYKIISKSLEANYTELSFVHFDHPDALLTQKQLGFTHLILKLTDRESFDFKVKDLKKKMPNSVFIGLVIKREFHTLKAISHCFDFIFNESEIEEKLTIYFNQQLNKYAENNAYPSRLVTEKNKTKYIQLSALHSRCLVLVSLQKTNKEIALEISKSERTVEKYIIFLRTHFGVEKKKELIKIVKEIAGN